MAVDPHEIDLTGLIDLHIHTAPDTMPRYADDLEATRAAAEVGMRAILIKSHWTLTADRAAIAEKAVGSVRVFGGLALNRTVGGLNPRAVEVALAMGARQIWMPTHDAAHVVRQKGAPGGLTILGDDGRIVPAVYEIIDLVRDAQAILGTGHLSVAETVALARLARDRGLGKLVVTHPEARFVAMPTEVQEEISGEGVFFERCYLNALPGHGVGDLGQIAAQIRRVGAGSTVLATDLGQAGNPSPAEGLRTYLTGLLAAGLSREEIRVMSRDNPADLLGL